MLENNTVQKNGTMNYNSIQNTVNLFQFATTF